MKAFLIAILAASTAWAAKATKPSSGPHAEIHRTTRKLSDLPPMDFSNARDTGLTLGPLKSKSKANNARSLLAERASPPSEKVVVPETASIGPLQCLDPAHNSAPDTDDCTRVCNAIRGYTSPVIVGPLEIEEWSVATCTFAIANLQPCETLDIDPLSLFASGCEHMLSQCVANGQDGFAPGTPPPFAIALYGTPAAPPYSEHAC